MSKIAWSGLLLLWLYAASFAVAQSWEVDWELVGDIGVQVVDHLEDSGALEQLNLVLMAADIDWHESGRFVDRALQSSSWETVAEWLPEAIMLLQTLERIPQAAPATDWLAQRIAYFEMSNFYVQQALQRRDAAERPPLGTRQPPARPRSQELGSSAASPPRQQPVAIHEVSLGQDTLDWLARVPEEPKPSAQRMVPGLQKIFIDEGVDDALVWLAEVESSFNPQAVSPAGATGLFQFMPATAERFGLRLKPSDQRLDPKRSARAAAQYLRILHRQFNDWPLAVAAYNAGEGRVGRAVKQSGSDQFDLVAAYLPVETRMYVPRVAAIIQKRTGRQLSGLPSPP